MKLESDFRKKKSLELSKDFLSLLLPELLVTHFDIIDFRTENKIIHMHFEEKKDTPKEEKNRTLIAHVFHKEITIQDFPLRGKTVYLHVKRRRWLDKSNSQIVQRDWNLVAKGSRMTVEFAAFLKVLSRY